MPKRRRGLPGAGRKLHFHGLTRELTGPGILIVARLKSASEFLLEIIIKVRGSSLNTGLRCSQTRASAFSLKKIDDRARWLLEPARLD
jgi:hypothetical protein